MADLTHIEVEDVGHGPGGKLRKKVVHVTLPPIRIEMPDSVAAAMLPDDLGSDFGLHAALLLAVTEPIKRVLEDYTAPAKTAPAENFDAVETA